MTIFLTIVHVIVCFILILVILLQAGRGQGLSGASFGSGNVQSVLGTRAADFLTKATSVAAICFLFTCIGLDIIEARKSRSLLQAPTAKNTAVNIDQIKQMLNEAKAETETAAKETAASAGETAKAGSEAAAETMQAGKAAMQQEAAKSADEIQTETATQQ